MNHIPVMLNEVIEQLTPKDSGIYVDCTFGAGGYSRKILESKDCKLYSIDQDPNVQEFATQLTQEFGDRFTFIQDNFSNLEKLEETHNLKKIDGIVFDLGVSSMQVDQAERGFSFNKDARLDMRMSQDGTDAWEVVNKYSEEDLADIIYYYGEERFSRRIAKNIVQSRKEKPINSTLELAAIVKSSIRKTGKNNPATKTFQAIRVYVNDELKVLKKAIDTAFHLLSEDGVIIIVSFQGLEDKIVKEFVSNNDNAKAKIYKPTSLEIKENPRSRSAKLRTIRRIK